jgi:DNA-binding HxlR family transcriptional regulator
VPVSPDIIRAMTESCSLPVALEAMGERWSFLILRGAFGGMRHFEQFHDSLGIARNILANRLSRLVAHGILARRPCEKDRRKVEYCLTDKGEALLPTLVALRQWGDRWGAGIDAEGRCAPMLVDARDGAPVPEIEVRAADGRTLGRHDLAWVPRS